MNALEPRAPVVGHPLRWSLDFALLGGLLPVITWLSILWWYSALGSVGSIVGPVLALAGAGALSGSVVGAMLARFFETIRGQVPLSLLGVAVTTGGATWGLVIYHLGSAALGTGLGGHVAMMAIGLCGLVMGAMWLPYTVASVLRRPTLPVVAAALLTSAPLAIAIEWLLPVVLQLKAALL